ncbi:Cna B-type domain-containing protein [Erysipelothrix sp. HDW6A]|uniref:Cna B-type domain-containing protein n=1 Tax=Erysipelothrix sp. HDW6A TaxID=2714928 RepID=UPI00140A6556|nr:Cna B-type domain-containing protein [Erysipelothrix sp. HDW6A]QIK57103.1 Cna B-type domain-containing protein [Erysipelothrix sp. HDW6A]
MKKRIRLLVIIFGVFLTTIPIFANEGFLSRFEIYDNNSESNYTYLSGAKVTLYTGFSISQAIDRPITPVLEIMIPKEYIEINGVESGDIEHQKTKKIFETDTDIVIQYHLETLQGGAAIDVAVVFNSQNGYTPKDFLKTISATIKDANDPSLTGSTSKEIKFTHLKDYFYKSVYKESTSGNYWSTNLAKIDAGLEDKQNPGYFSKNIDDLKSVEYSFQFYEFVNGSSKKEGERYYEKIIIDDTLPPEAVFIQEDNPGWIYDEPTHSARFEYIFGKPIQLNNKSLENRIRLKLKYPGASVAARPNNSSKIIATQWNQSNGEQDVILTDDLEITLGVVSDNAYPGEVDFKKTSTKYTNVDVQSERDQILSWKLTLKNVAKISEFPDARLENAVFVDKDLDPLLQYDSVTLPRIPSTSFVGAVDILARYNDGREILVAENQNMSEVKTFELEDKENVVAIEIKFTEGSYLIHEKIFDVFIGTKLRNPNINVVEASNTSSKLSNTTEYFVNYTGSPQFSKSVTAYLEFYAYNPKISIMKDKNTPETHFFADSIIEYKIDLFVTEMLKGEIIETNTILDILPIGMEYVQGSTYDRYDGVISHLEDPEIIHNYKNTGQTALKWNIDSIKNTSVYQIPAIVNIYTLRYKTRITKSMTPGSNINTAYLSWKNIDLIGPISEKNATEDIYDLNENGSTEDFVLTSNKTIQYLPTKELYGKKEVMGNLDNGYIMAPGNGLSEIGTNVRYKLTISNYLDASQKTLKIIDLLPSIGDKTASFVVENEVLQRVNRGTTFRVSLAKEVEAPEGYQVQYTKDTIGEDIPDFMANANWENTLDDYSLATAIKIVLLDGYELKSNESVSFYMEFDIPKESSLHELDRAVNSFGFSTLLNGYQFTESNLSTLDLIKYYVEGNVFDDVNRNGLFDENVDEIFEQHIVKLVDEEGNTVKDLEGNDYSTTTDSLGYYRFEVYRHGNYKVQILAPDEYQLIEPTSNELGSGIVDVTNGYSDTFTLDYEKTSQRINAGYIPQQVSLKIEKILKDSSGNIKTDDTKFNFIFKVNNEMYNGKAKIDGVIINVANGAFVLKGGESIIIESLDIHSIYSVEEEENSNYYVTPQLGKLEGELDQLNTELTFINTERKLIDVSVTKEWVGGPSPRPTIEVQLYRDGEAFGAAVALENGTTSYTWTGLHETDASGKAYVYTVDEVQVPKNYTKEVNGFVITNTYVSPLIDISVTKEWVGGPSPRPTIEVQLYRDGEVFGTAVALENGITSYTWTGLDETDVSGKAYVYTVDEVQVPENYTKEVNGFVITNTYVSPLIDISVTKEWVGGPSPRPTIEVQLYRDGEVFGTAVALENGITSYTWTGLDETDVSGKAYVYTVDEVQVPENYTKEVNGFVIRNVYSKPVDPTDPVDPTEPTDPTDPEKPIVPEKPIAPPIPSLPETGVSNQIAYTSAILSALGAVLILARKRRKNR